MEAEELRIGNLEFNENNQIVTIDATRIMFLQDKRVKYNPIPLTEEWLLKFGYISDGHIFSEESSFYRKGGHEIWRPFHRFLDELYRIEIKHVHQLQNLYFATQQEELKLEQS